MTIEGHAVSPARAPVIWREPPRLTREQLTLTSHPVISAVLHARGIHSREEAEAFLFPAKVDLADPRLLPDLERAAALIRSAIDTGVPIGIFGDYDVDGLTSSAMLYRVLVRLGGNVHITIPNRLSEVYGLTVDAIDRFHSAGVGLLIAVDCGSSNAAELRHALQRGMRCIVLDHHHLGDALPPEVAFVSPRRPESRFPMPNPAAVGVVWQLVRALLDAGDADMYLPYVALGTVADVVDLRGQNRTLVTRGISKLRRWKLPGFVALCRHARVDQARIRAREVGFALAPRLNAAGRMDSPQLALNLLLADNLDDASRLALRLNDLNERRQAETTRILEEIEQRIAAAGGVDQVPAIIEADPSWSIGIAGVVAGRLAERHQRPTIVLERGDELTRGSGRSGGAIDLVGALNRHADILGRFGGHVNAAGLSLPTEHLDAFRGRFCQTVLEMSGGLIPGRVQQPDAEARLSDLNLELVEAFDMLEPFGAGNRYPQLLVRDVATRWEKTSADGRHLIFSIVTPDKRSVQAVFFGAGARMHELTQAGRIDIVGELQRDDWDGRVRPKFYVDDFRPAR